MLQLISTCWNSPLALTVTCILAVAGYVPLNRFLRSGVQPKSWWDDYIPFIPAFIVPYLFVYMAWLGWFYLSLIGQPVILVQQVLVATLVATGVGYTSFFMFPTHVIQLPTRQFGNWKLLYDFLELADKEFNACPSMHVYMCVVLSFFTLNRFDSLVLDALVIITGAIIIFSTVLTKRHYFYDVIGGLIVGTIAVGASVIVTPLL